jgi:carbamate kinase
MLGGNAISARESKGTAEEQFDKVRRTCKPLVGIIQQGHRVRARWGFGCASVVVACSWSEALALLVFPVRCESRLKAETNGVVEHDIEQKKGDFCYFRRR